MSASDKSSDKSSSQGTLDGYVKRAANADSDSEIKIEISEDERKSIETPKPSGPVTRKRGRDEGSSSPRTVYSLKGKNKGKEPLAEGVITERLEDAIRAVNERSGLDLEWRINRAKDLKRLAPKFYQDQMEDDLRQYEDALSQDPLTKCPGSIIDNNKGAALIRKTAKADEARMDEDSASDFTPRRLATFKSSASKRSKKMDSKPRAEWQDYNTSATEDLRRKLMIKPSPSVAASRGRSLSASEDSPYVTADGKPVYEYIGFAKATNNNKRTPVKGKRLEKTAPEDDGISGVLSSDPLNGLTVNRWAALRKIITEVQDHPDKNFGISGYQERPYRIVLNFDTKEGASRCQEWVEKQELENVKFKLKMNNQWNEVSIYVPHHIDDEPEQFMAIFSRRNKLPPGGVRHPITVKNNHHGREFLIDVDNSVLSRLGNIWADAQESNPQGSKRRRQCFLAPIGYIELSFDRKRAAQLAGRRY